MPSYGRVDPFRDLLQLQNSLVRAFDTIDGAKTVHSHGEHALVSGTWQPLIDVLEDQDRIVVKVELSEMAEKDIDLRVEGNTLTVRGERKLDSGIEREGYRLIERTYGSFQRSFTLPDTVDADNIRAEARDGVLRVVLPKRAESKARHIKVQVEAPRLDKPEAHKQ
jgi:HSP20 family protein